MNSDSPPQQPAMGIPASPASAAPSSHVPYPPYPPYPPYQASTGYPPIILQQPYPGVAPPTPSTQGYNGEAVAGLGYLFFLVGLIMFFAERHNRFVKFHAAQSLLIHLAALLTGLVWALLFLVVTVTGAAASVGTGSPSRMAAGLVALAILVVTLFALVLYVAYLGALIWGMIAAFTGKATKLPLVGDLAERWSRQVRW